MKVLIKRLLQTPPMKPLYRLLVGRKKTAEFWVWGADDQKRLEFYSQFIKKGDLVFDVGANIGNRSKIFHRLGAHVVAFEPQNHCADYLEMVFHGLPCFMLERVGLGSAPGEAEMLVSDASTISSLSPEWVSSVQDSGRFSGHEWNGRQVIRIDTLDNQIKKHGVPVFIKIDVEGFEEQVLLGLSQGVKAVSFEFTPEMIGNALGCIRALEQVRKYQYRFSFGESMAFSHDKWLDADGMGDYLAQVPQQEFGDVYARSIHE